MRAPDSSDFAILNPSKRIGRRVANRRDPERQPDAPERLAVLLGQMGVAFDEPGQDRRGPRVHHDAAMQVVTVRRHLRDAVALDDDVHVLGDGRASPVEQPSRMHGRGPGGLPGGPRELRHDVADAAVGEIHQAEPIERLIEHVPRVGCPRRRAGVVGRQPARRARGRAVRRHGIRHQEAVDDRRHLAAVRRPHRPQVLAHADRFVRQGIEPSIRGERPASGSRRLGLDLHSEYLVGAFAEPRRVRVQRGHHDRASVRRPARAAGLVQSVVDLAPLAALDVHHLQLRLRIEVGQTRAVRRPRRRGAATRHAPIAPGPQVADPDVHRAAAIGRECQLRSIRRPGRVHLDIDVLRQALGHGFPTAGRHRPQIAERGKRHACAIRRDHRVHQAADRLRSFAGEVVPLRREGRPREGDIRGERHRAGRTTGARPALDDAVGGVEQLGRAHPLRPEGEDVLAGVAGRGGADLQAADRAAHRHVGDGLAVRRPRGREQGRRVGNNQPLSGPVHDTRIHAALRAVRDERNLSPIGRPCRHAVVGGVGRQAADLAGRHGHDPDVVVAATVGGEGQAGAIR